MSGDLRIRVLPSIGEVPADAWDGCANPEVQEVSSLPAFNPFISHDFLSALEESRSAQARKGNSDSARDTMCPTIEKEM